MSSDLRPAMTKGKYSTYITLRRLSDGWPTVSYTTCVQCISLWVYRLYDARSLVFRNRPADEELPRPDHRARSRVVCFCFVSEASEVGPMAWCVMGIICVRRLLL